MVDFRKFFQKNDPDQGSKPANEPKPATNKNVATAEYSYLHIHQIKAWSRWSVNQEEIDYTVDPPVHLNS